jgi:glycosyl transferase family 9 (putative heptosyltransferase)
VVERHSISPEQGRCFAPPQCSKVRCALIQQKILVAINLIGDSIYLLGPVRKYLEVHPGEVAAILVDKKMAGQLFVRQFANSGVPVVHSEEEARAINPEAEFLRLEAGMSGTLCHGIEQRFGKCPHISEGYARILGVDIEGRQEPPVEWQSYYGKSFPKEYSLIFPFSKSCSRHDPAGKMRPNKTLDDWKWEHILHFLRRHGYEPVKVEGGPGERMQGVSILESDYLESRTLPELELSIRKASVAISVDNGLAHLASALGTMTIVLWPAASSQDFIAPIWSPTTAIMHMGDPNEIQPVQLLMGLRQLLPRLEERVSHVSSSQT